MLKLTVNNYLLFLPFLVFCKIFAWISWKLLSVFWYLVVFCNKASFLFLHNFCIQILFITI